MYILTVLSKPRNVPGTQANDPWPTESLEDTVLDALAKGIFILNSWDLYDFTSEAWWSTEEVTNAGYLYQILAKINF